MSFKEQISSKKQNKFTYTLNKLDSCRDVSPGFFPGHAA